MLLEIIELAFALIGMACFVWGILYFLPDKMPWNKGKKDKKRWWDDDFDD